MGKKICQGRGWLPDIPDIRDFGFTHQSVLSMLQRLARPEVVDQIDEVDLRVDEDGEYFPPVDDQGTRNSSTAFAVLALAEYFHRRVLGNTFNGSPRFLYKVTRQGFEIQASYARQSLCEQSDCGASIRNTFKALNRFGTPPERRFSYHAADFNEEPHGFIYRLARPPFPLIFFRLDEANCTGRVTWERIESFVSAGFPVVFGFSVPESISLNPDIPYRDQFESFHSGQAALIVGFRKNHFGVGEHGLRIRNSWGASWGSNGYGWLPKSFVDKQLARDFWTCVSESWFGSGYSIQPLSCDLSCPTIVPLSPQ